VNTDELPAVDDLHELVPERVPLLAWAGTAIAAAQALELAVFNLPADPRPAVRSIDGPVVLAKRIDGLRGDPLGRLLKEVYGMSGAS
jgi:hypothetical protein